MKINYYVQNYGNMVTPIITIKIPRELVSKCNFVHKDRFSIKVTSTNIVITYNQNGNYKLAKSGNALALNVSAKIFTSQTFQLLKDNEARYLIGNIVNNELILDTSKLSGKQKGFELWKNLPVVEKGFGLHAK